MPDTRIHKNQWSFVTHNKLLEHVIKKIKKKIPFEIITTGTKDFYEESYKSLLKVILKRLKRGAMYAYQWKDSV